MKKKNENRDAERNEEMESLNEELYSNFSIEELESRYETMADTMAWLACGVDCPKAECVGKEVTIPVEKN